MLMLHHFEAPRRTCVASVLHLLSSKLATRRDGTRILVSVGTEGFQVWSQVYFFFSREELLACVTSLPPELEKFPT